MADLIARPIGKHVMNPEQENRACDIIKGKLRTRNGRVRVLLAKLERRQRHLVDAGGIEPLDRRRL